MLHHRNIHKCGRTEVLQYCRQAPNKSNSDTRRRLAGLIRSKNLAGSPDRGFPLRIRFLDYGDFRVLDV